MKRFKSELGNIKRLINQGKYDQAHQILNQHINEEHGFLSDFTGLQRSLAAYQQELRNLQGMWLLTNDPHSPKTTAGNLPNVKQKIEILEGHLVSIEYHLKRLLQEE